MTDKNELLSWRDTITEIERKVPIKPQYKRLPENKQKIFKELHGLSGDEYQEKLKEL